MLIEKDNKYYIKKKDKLEKLGMFTDNYYTLKPYNGIPILEINGIRMHLIKDFDTPLDYAKLVLNTIKINSQDLVYDTCSGLGYLAIEEAKFAKKVISTELRKEILELGKLNPYSNDFFNNKKINIIKDSCLNQILKFKDKEINIIIHDPPTFSIAGELYSLNLYKEFYRTLNNNGKLFHYIGTIGKNKNRRFDLEIIKRLKQVGFKNCKYYEKLQAIICEKI